MADSTVRRAPLERNDYEIRRGDFGRYYTESIREYDRLVTWASGGALALSITFLEKFGYGADRRTAWWLGAGWVLLGAGLAASLWSQYCSSRIYSWRLRELDHLQTPVTERSAAWSVEAARLDRIARIFYGRATKCLTFASGVLLVGGIMSVAFFAFLNAPFKGAENNTSVTPREVAAPVTDKKGLEYIPEPVPRPPSSAPSPSPQVPPPAEKR